MLEYSILPTFKYLHNFLRYGRSKFNNSGGRGRPKLKGFGGRGFTQGLYNSKNVNHEQVDIIIYDSHSHCDWFSIIMDPNMITAGNTAHSQIFFGYFFLNQSFHHHFLSYLVRLAWAGFLGWGWGWALPTPTGYS